MPGSTRAFPNPFLDKPKSDPFAFRTLSFEERAAVDQYWIAQGARYAGRRD